MKGTVKRSVENQRNGSLQICLGCGCWEPTAPTSKCSHPEIAILEVKDHRDLSVLSGLAKAAARAERQRIIALGAINSFVQDFRAKGAARVQATQINAGNVRSLPVRRVA